MDLKRDSHIVWIDTELTGLDTETCQILEVACLITDKNLNVISTEFSVVIHQPKEVLDNMNEWCIKHHAQTGLTQDSLSSKILLTDAEQMLLNFLKQYIPRNTCPLAGNTVYMDRIFLMKHMPLVNQYLHYRIIDVTSVKELLWRWRPAICMNASKKKLQHRALSDIKESIAELKYYRDNMFKCIHM